MVDIFKNISEKNQRKLLSSLEANTIILKEGASLFSVIGYEQILGIVKAGTINIIKREYNDLKYVIDTLEVNSVFSSTFSFFNSKEYDIVASIDSIVIIIDYFTIFDKEVCAPYFGQFAKNLLEIMSWKVLEINERLQILSKRTVRDKILEYFKIMANKKGSKIIEMPMSYLNLAKYLSVDRSAMTREIKNLIEDGIIKKDDKKIILLYR